MSSLNDELVPGPFLIGPKHHPDEVRAFLLEWRQAFDMPSDHLRRAAGFITAREKYRTRAASYLYRFLYALFVKGTQSEIVDLAIEAKLLPMPSDDIEVAKEFFQRLLSGEVQDAEMFPLRTAFRKFWSVERRKAGRANCWRRKEDPYRWAKYVRKPRASYDVL